MLLTPTSPTTAFRLGEKRAIRWRCTWSTSSRSRQPGGLPAMSVPCGFDADGPADRAAAHRPPPSTRRRCSSVGARRRDASTIGRTACRRQHRTEVARESTWEPVIGLEVHCQLVSTRPSSSAAARRRSARARTPTSARCAWACRRRCRCSTGRSWSTRCAAGLATGLAIGRGQSVFAARTTSIRTCPRATRSASTTSPICEHG